MAAVVPGLDAARRATVRICDCAGTHRGQGLLLDDTDGRGAIVLTCHHVIAPLEEGELCVSLPLDGRRLGDPLQARYDNELSHPERDAVVLRLSGVSVSQRPPLYELRPKTYTGSRAIDCIMHLNPDRFGARVETSTRLAPIEAKVTHWPRSPAMYELPDVFPLAAPGQARKGISGAVGLCEGGVLGLVHFARAESPEAAREVYLVPLTAWAEGWPDLAERIEPLVDRRLRNASKGIRRANALRMGVDVMVPGYQSDLYVKREVDRRVRDALDNEAYDGVVIAGKPLSGKTRLVWELLQQRPKALVVVPDEDQPPQDVDLSGLATDEVIIFIDDLCARSVELRSPRKWQKCFQAPEERRCLLVCTARNGGPYTCVHDNWRDLFGPNRERMVLDFTSTVGNTGQDFPEEGAWEIARKRGLSREEFDRSFRETRTPGWLTVDLDDMKRRYERLRADESLGYPMSLLLDAAKLLKIGALQPRLRPRIWRKVAAQLSARGKLTKKDWKRLQRRAEEEKFGHMDGETGEFQPYQLYLERCLEYRPQVSQIENLLPVLAEEEDAQGLVYLALALEDLSPGRAAEACEVAIELGNPHARELSGILLEKQGHIGAAEEAFRAAIDAGLEEANYILGNLLAGQPGRQAEAEEAFRAAIRAGVAAAHLNLGRLLASLPGREEEAQRAFEEADAAGDLNALRNLGVVLQRQHREKEAEDWFEAAANKGNVQAWIDLGEIRQARGDLEGAEKAYREAAEAGFEAAWCSLGDLLASRPGRAKEAEQAYRAAIGAGEMAAHNNLGVLLASSPGREAEAAPEFQEAINAGVEEARNNLRILNERLSLQVGNQTEMR